MTPHRSVVRALSRHCQGATLTSRRSRSSMRLRTMVSSRSDQVRHRGSEPRRILASPITLPLGVPGTPYTPRTPFAKWNG